jgi:hypothetical protein
MSTYNGWTNYATWRVNAECFGDWDIGMTFSSKEWTEILNDYMEDAITRSGDIVDSEVTNEERAFWFRTNMVAYMADYLAELPQSWIEDVKDITLQGWLEAWLAEVNWREIAEHHLEADGLYMQVLANIKEGAEVLY